MLDELNVLCDANIALDHLSENHRLRYLHGLKFDVQRAFDILLLAERTRYNFGCDRVSGEDVRNFG